jgi:hypothetical protein
MKTQTLNTVFTGNAAPLQSEVNKLVGNVNSAISGIMARSQASLAISRTTGMTAANAQSGARVETTLGLPGMTAAMAAIEKQRTMGATGGVDMVLRKMGIAPGDFWKERDSNKRALMITENFGKLSKREQMIYGDILGGQGEMWMQAAGQEKMHPGAMKKAIMAAKPVVPEGSQATVESAGIVARGFIGGMKDTFLRGFTTLAGNLQAPSPKEQARLENVARKRDAYAKEMLKEKWRGLWTPMDSEPENFGKPNAWDVLEFQQRQEGHLKKIADHTKNTSEAVK